MAEKTVLFVGLPEEQVVSLPLPEEVEATSVVTSQEAVDQLSLSPVDLIVANDKIGELSSLDFFGQISDLDPENAIPVIFLASPESGVQSFLYQRRQVGFEVRYLDKENNSQSFFVNEPTTEKAFTIRAVKTEELAEEVARAFSGDQPVPGQEEGDWEERAWEIGFNQDVNAQGRDYHVQTEVISVDPITACTHVFVAGQALHCEETRVKGRKPNLTLLRSKVQSLHVQVIAKIRAGEIDS